jgi:hypothetical protein
MKHGGLPGVLLASNDRELQPLGSHPDVTGQARRHRRPAGRQSSIGGASSLSSMIIPNR